MEKIDMRPAKISRLTGVVFLMFVFAACGGGGGGSNGDVPTLDGATIFSQNCAVCHGENATGIIGPNIQGKTAVDIRNALNTVPQMSVVGPLTDEQVNAVAGFLATLVN